MPDFNPISGTCDFALVAGKKTPGFTIVEGNNGSPRKWEERGGYGLTGATVYFTGRGLGKWDLIISLYTVADWADWHAFRPTLDPPKLGVRAKALDFWHPYTKALGIGKAVVLDVGLPRQTEDGVWQILVPMLEFRTPRLTFAKPDGAKSSDSDDPVDRRINQNGKQIAELLDKLAK